MTLEEIRTFKSKNTQKSAAWVEKEPKQSKDVRRGEKKKKKYKVKKYSSGKDRLEQR
jgi:hypothetical protein